MKEDVTLPPAKQEVCKAIMLAAEQIFLSSHSPLATQSKALQSHAEQIFDLYPFGQGVQIEDLMPFGQSDAIDHLRLQIEDLMANKASLCTPK